jgi:hypothetical protein
VPGAGFDGLFYWMSYTKRTLRWTRHDMGVQYYVVFIRKCRTRTCTELRRGRVFHKLAPQKEPKIEEGHVMISGLGLTTHRKALVG